MTKQSGTSKDKRRGTNTTKPMPRSTQSKPREGALSDAQLDQVSAGAGQPGGSINSGGEFGR